MDVSHLSIEHDKQSRRKIVNSRFKLLQTIGQGSYGKVLLAQDLTQLPNTPQYHVAIKTIHRVDTARLITKTYLSHTTKIKREIQIMKECDHPNVVKLFQVIDDMKFDKILLVLEYCTLGEIDWRHYNHYHEKYYQESAKRLPLNRILRDVANGLEYLHSYKHIIHRDLKPSNLLISSDRTIKISDFGVSLILENNANDDRELGKTMGTPAFFAPELCQFVNNRLSSFNDSDLKRSKIDGRIDLWSLGVTLYCLFFHQLPFEGFNEFGLFKNIVNGALRFPGTRNSSLARPDDFAELSALQDLIKRLLAKDPSDRPTLAEIKAHAFTNFDLSKAEAEKFRNMNRQIISSQSPAAAEAFAAESRLTSKLRKLFIGRAADDPIAEAASVERGAKAAPNAESSAKVHPLDLEKVDDLLDSYLDDSSSFGSFEDDSDPVVVDTSNLLDALSNTDKAAPENDHFSTHTLNYPDAALRNSSPGGFSSVQSVQIPPPLKLSNSNFDLSKSKHSPLSNLASGVRMPVSTTTSTHPVVTIGPDSPVSSNAVYSPTRRFLDRFKKKSKKDLAPAVEPKISALFGNAADTAETGYTKFAPPPGFGGSKEKPRSNRSSLTSFDSHYSAGPGLPRKNSVCSTSSGAISKISSSGSSLNLHAYLMDTPSVSASSEMQDSAKSITQEEYGDDTQSMGASSGEADRTMSMDQFLDRLGD